MTQALGKQPPYQRYILVLHVVFGDQKTKSAVSEPKVKNILYASIQHTANTCTILGMNLSILEVTNPKGVRLLLS